MAKFDTGVAPLAALRLFRIEGKFRYKISQVVALIWGVLEYLPRGIPDYTNHGITHSINITKELNRFFKKLRFTPAEKYLLYLAAWTHDLGCLRKRKNHNEESVRILNKNRLIFEKLMGSEAFPALVEIILAHSKKYDLERIATTISVFRKNDTRLRWICCLFKFIDACDITHQRAHRMVYNLIKDDLGPRSKRYWQAHLSTPKLHFVFRRREVIVCTEDAKKSRILIGNLEDELRSIKRALGKDNFPFSEIRIESLIKS